jgi:hypothetical protein
MRNKKYQFTTSTTTSKKSVLNANSNDLNKVPEQGSIKLIIDDKLGEEGLGIKLNLSSQQIRMLGYLLGSQAEHRKVFTTLKVLIEIVETAKETIISKTIIDNEVKKLKNSYKSLSVKEKEKYSSIEEYIEQNLTNSSIELQEKIEKVILSKNIDEEIFEN